MIAGKTTALGRKRHSIQLMQENRHFLRYIILLTHQIAAGTMVPFLKNIRPDIDIYHTETIDDLRAIDPEIRGSSRLIAFGSPVIVPASYLKTLGFGAYNIHPGPPSHPGWAPTCFAVYDGATTLGATAHEMVAKVDAGPIVGTELFDADPGKTTDELREQALVAALYLFKALAPALVTSNQPLPVRPIGWGAVKRTRKDLAAMCRMSRHLDPIESARRIRAFTTNEPDWPQPSVVAD
jgi:methionyl-tRNA formyltransferase